MVKLKKKIPNIEGLQKYNYHIIDLTGIKLQIMKNRTLQILNTLHCKALRLISENKVFLKLPITYSPCGMMCCLFSVWQKPLLQQLKFTLHQQESFKSPPDKLSSKGDL